MDVFQLSTIIFESLVICCIFFNIGNLFRRNLRPSVFHVIGGVWVHCILKVLHDLIDFERGEFCCGVAKWCLRKFAADETELFFGDAVGSYGSE